MIMFGRSVNLTTTSLGWLRPTKRLTVLHAHTFTSNCQLSFLNQRNEKRNYVAGPDIKPATSALESDALPTALRSPDAVLSNYLKFNGASNNNNNNINNFVLFCDKCAI